MPYSDTLSLREIRKSLSEECHIDLFPEIDSTNKYIKDNISLLDNGHIVISDCQTDGKGRFQRAFFSPVGTGLYLSILLKHDFPNDYTDYITSAAAVAVCRAVEFCTGAKAKIKWPNDILLDGKKIAGILTEAIIRGGNIQSVIIGIGVNVYCPKNGFPVELNNTAGHLADKPLIGLRNQLASALIHNIFEIEKNPATLEITSEYSEKSAVIGSPILIRDGEIASEAIAKRIDSRRRLIAITKDGKEVVCSSGEISVRIINDTQ